MSQFSTEAVFGQVQQSLKNKKYYQALQQLLSISLKCSKDIKFLTFLSETQKALHDLNGLIITQQEIVRQRGLVFDQLNLMRSFYLANKKNEALDIGLKLQNDELAAGEDLQLSDLMVRIYLEENDFEGAAEAILKAQNSESDDFLLWAQGVVYLNNDQKNHALEYFRRSVQMNPKNDQAWVSLGIMHKDMGDETLFLANIEKALDLNPYNASALKLLSHSAAKNIEKVPSTFSRVQFYLAEHCFDEEISLCHFQLLCGTRNWKWAELEAEKLVLNEPQNETFKNLKKTMGEARSL